jgi:hypothetical protein
MSLLILLCISNKILFLRYFIWRNSEDNSSLFFWMVIFRLIICNIIGTKLADMANDNEDANLVFNNSFDNIWSLKVGGGINSKNIEIKTDTNK